MEILLLQQGSVKIKGKTATFVLKPQDTSPDVSGAFYLDQKDSRPPTYDGGITIDSPGEYEIGGVKIKGVTNSNEITFSINIDGISLLLGTLSALEKVHGKLQEHDLTLVDVDTLVDPSFVSGLSTHGILYTGEKATELSETYLKDESQVMSKFSSTKDKLPQEMVTILLQ